MREARKLVKGIEDTDRIPESEKVRLLFWKVWGRLSHKEKKAVLAECKKNREHFARSSTPGHFPWYTSHLQVEAFAEELVYPDGMKEEAPKFSVNKCSRCGSGNLKDEDFLNSPSIVCEECGLRHLTPAQLERFAELAKEGGELFGEVREIPIKEEEGDS